MTTEVEVLDSSPLPDLSNNYALLENTSVSVVSTLANQIVRLIYENEKPSNDDINNALDLADSMIKLLAVTHKGREVEIRRQQNITYVEPESEE